MNGKQPIVVRIENSYQFAEHPDVESAKREAHRLARKEMAGTFVVYVPVAIVTKTPPTREVATDFSGQITPDDDASNLPF